jgi:hypothetical protein
MITIFCDFCQFLAKNGVLSKNNVMITICAKNNNSLSKKRKNFRSIFRRKYLKNHNIGPWSRSVETSFSDQVCQMVYFQTKNPKSGIFLGALEWKMLVYLRAIWNYLEAIWYTYVCTLWPFCTFCGHFGICFPCL